MAMSLPIDLKNIRSRLVVLQINSYSQTCSVFSYLGNFIVYCLRITMCMPVGCNIAIVME